MSFHEVRFPTGISRGATGGPERRTEIVTLGSGFEERNSRWADSRRTFNAGYGVRSLADIHEVIAFFEERRGRLYGFRWKDHTDFKSGLPGSPAQATDQALGTGDAVTAVFQAAKIYGTGPAAYRRVIHKLVLGTLRLAVAGAAQVEGVDFDADYDQGAIVFRPGRTPAAGQAVTAGFEFDVPVRFDTDRLEISLQSFAAGSIPSIPVVEIRL